MRRARQLVPIMLLATLALAGCTQDGPSPVETPDAAPSASAAAGPAAYVPAGTAADNKPIFDETNLKTIAANGSASSGELVAALAAAGFEKSTMEVTFDRTNVDLEADYIIVSAKFGEDCLIGQRGPQGYTSDVVAPMSNGKCLVGLTQEIT